MPPSSLNVLIICGPVAVFLPRVHERILRADDRAVAIVDQFPN
jgi:hypothetical protein